MEVKKFDISDILLFINNFSDPYFTANFKSLDIELAKTTVFNEFSEQQDILKGSINESQFNAIKRSIKDKIRSKILR